MWRERERVVGWMREENKHKSSFFIVFYCIVDSQVSSLTHFITTHIASQTECVDKGFFSLYFFFSLSRPPSSISAHIVYINNHNRLNLSTHRHSRCFVRYTRWRWCCYAIFLVFKKNIFVVFFIYLKKILTRVFSFFTCLKKNCVAKKVEVKE